jgi:hypothetical protein
MAECPSSDILATNTDIVAFQDEGSKCESLPTSKSVLGALMQHQPTDLSGAPVYARARLQALKSRLNVSL